MADPASTLFKQHGKTKRSNHRQLLIAGAGAVLLVVYLMHRKSAAATAAAVPAAVDPTALPPASGSGSPATFADNGAQAATLGDNVTNSLSGLQTSVDSQTSAFQTLSDTLTQQQATAAAAAATPAAAAADPTASGSQSVGAAPYVWDPVAAFAYVAAHPPNTPAGNTGQPAAGAATAARVNAQAGNPRQGQTYTTQAAKGGVYHVYAGGKKIFVKK